MKKIITFLPLLLVMICVLACDLEIPTAVEIRGTPSLNLKVNMDFNDLFKDMLDDAFDDNETIILDCTHDSLTYKTFIISMELYNENLNIEGGSVTAGQELVKRDESKTTISLGDLGDSLKDFVFNEAYVKSKIFVGGSDIVKYLETTLYYGVPETSIPIDGKTSPEKSGITANSKEYNASAIMDGGEDIDISDYLANKKDLEIEFKVVSPDPISDSGLIDNAAIRIELVIWLPFVFKAEKDNAVFKIPGFEELGSLFTSLAETEMFKSINLDFGMKENSFIGKSLVIKNSKRPDDSKFRIERTIGEENLAFALEKEHLDYINDTEEFEMDFGILYAKKDDELYIKKGLKIMSVSIETDISKRFGEDE